MLTKQEQPALVCIRFKQNVLLMAILYHIKHVEALLVWSFCTKESQSGPTNGHSVPQTVHRGPNYGHSVTNKVHGGPTNGHSV